MRSSVSKPDVPVIIQLVGLVGGQATGYDGEYVQEYDPSTTFPGCPDEHQRAGECWLITTPNPALAKRYAGFLEAMAEWNRVDERQPIRQDGNPNKPLSAFSIVVDTIDG